MSWPRLMPTGEFPDRHGGRAVIDVANPVVWAGWAGGTLH
jgi:hypothetical protein